MFDHVKDRNHSELYRLQYTMELPTFVKEASLATDEDVKGLSTELFASPDRSFPIHTRADTWASVAFFDKQACKLPDWQKEAIARKLTEAVKFWNLEGTFKKIDKPLTKEASESCTINYVDESGITRSSLTVTTNEGFKKVAQDLFTNWRSYPYPTRKSVAKQLHRAMDKFAEALSDADVTNLEKVAGIQVAHKRNVNSTIGLYREWCKYAHRKDLIPALDKVAESLSDLADSGIVKEEALDKIASILDNVDHLAKLHTYPNAPIAPEMSFKGMTMKDAKVASKNMAKLANGDVVVLSKVAANGEAIRDFALNALGLNVTTMGDLQKLAEDDAAIICKAFPTITEM
jgi:hypothetical protein